MTQAENLNSPEKSEQPVSNVKPGNNTVRYIYTKSSQTLNQIKQAYIEIMKENKGHIPTLKDIRDKTGISQRQIQRHIKNIDWVSEYNEFFKLFIPEVTHSMLNEARKGNVPAAKLFYQFVADWKEKSDFDIKSGGEAFPTPQIIIKAPDQDS